MPMPCEAGCLQFLPQECREVRTERNSQSKNGGPVLLIISSIDAHAAIKLHTHKQGSDSHVVDDT